MRTTLKKAVVLLSGGMDSAALLFHVRRELKVREIHALSFNYGQKHAKELAMARRQAAMAPASRHLVIDISSLKALFEGGSALTDPRISVPALAALSQSERRQPPTYVPNRNAILLSVAAAYAEARGIGDIFYGAHAQDEYGYWDCTPRFLAAFNGVLSLNRRGKIKVHAPFLRMRKHEVLAIGLRLGVDYSQTWSCYRGARRPCGKCPTCVERAAALSRIRGP